MNIAQDIVYGASNGSKLTPKHIGLSSTLRQMTRSRELVELFHKAGHTLSYHQVMAIDTSLAENTLQTVNKDNGGVIPP